MDRVLACFATTAEDVAAMVCGSFSHMVPQASERWQRPAVKGLVSTIHQELCDPELLGRLAPVCKELGTACVEEATRMLSGIGLPVEAVMPEERVLTDRSHKPYPPQKRPPGLFPRLACLRVFEGLRVRCEVAELAERLRAMGAVVVTEAQQRAHVERFEGLRNVGRAGNCHEDTCMHAHAVANDSSEDLDLVVQGHEATPLRDDDDRLVGPVGVSVDMLRFFVLEPWVSEERTVASGADLSEDEVRELVNGGQGDWDADHVRAWATEGSQGGLPNWQDLTLRVHTHVRSGDRVYEWNYGLGDNDYGSYHYAPRKLPRASSFYFCANNDGDRDRVEADWPDECDEAAVNAIIWCIDYDIKNVECTPLVRFENPELQHFAHRVGSWDCLRKRRAAWAARLELVRAGEVTEDGGGIEADEYGPAAALLRGISVQHYRSSPYY